jgi:hypothetical protein
VRGARKAENRPARPCLQTSVRWTMKRKVAQRETQRAYAHASSCSAAEECDKVRRTGQNPIFCGSAESYVALLPTSSHLVGLHE